MQWGGGIRRKDLQNERCKYISGQRIFNFAENASRWDKIFGAAHSFYSNLLSCRQLELSLLHLNAKLKNSPR